MISIEDCRKKLGKIAENKTDEEIEVIRNKLYILCEIIVEDVSRKIKKPLINKDPAFRRVK